MSSTHTAAGEAPLSPSHTAGEAVSYEARSLREHLISHPPLKPSKKRVRSSNTELSSERKRRCLPFQNTEARERSELCSHVPTDLNPKTEDTKLMSVRGQSVITLNFTDS